MSDSYAESEERIGRHDNAAALYGLSGASYLAGGYFMHILASSNEAVRLMSDNAMQEQITQEVLDSGFKLLTGLGVLAVGMCAKNIVQAQKARA